MAAPVVHLYLTGDFFVKYRADKPLFGSTLTQFCELIHKTGQKCPLEVTF
ncbi:TPA: hypothetical protein L9L06_002961 [Klebsiella pneumoniae]|nr:hypothetical protein [Klebsiella pneumoniae]